MALAVWDSGFGAWDFLGIWNLGFVAEGQVRGAVPSAPGRAIVATGAILNATTSGPRP